MMRIAKGMVSTVASVTLGGATLLGRPVYVGAQVIVPNAQAASDGNMSNIHPFDCHGFVLGSMRYQQVYLGAEVGTRTITGIRFRRARDGSPFEPRRISDVTITLSSTNAPPDGLSATFSSNVGSDVTTVFAGDLTLSSGESSESPRPFDIVVPLAKPFRFNASTGNNLLLDVTIPACPQAEAAPLDAEAVVGDSVSRVVGGAGEPTAAVSDTAGLVTEFSSDTCADGRHRSCRAARQRRLRQRHAHLMS